MAENSINNPVDESLRRGFEAAWQNGRPGAIEAFLPPENAGRRRALLALVPIDLGYRWRLADKLNSVAGTQADTPPLTTETPAKASW